MKDIRGNESKNKRRIAIALLLLVMAFVTAIFLPKQDEPKVTGNLSKEDVSQCSKAALDFLRENMRSAMIYDLRNKDFKKLKQILQCYLKIKVLSIAKDGFATASVGVGMGTNEQVTFYMYKSNDSWTPPEELSGLLP